MSRFDDGYGDARNTFGVQFPLKVAIHWLVFFMLRTSTRTKVLTPEDSFEIKQVTSCSGRCAETGEGALRIAGHRAQWQ